MCRGGRLVQESQGVFGGEMLELAKKRAKSGQVVFWRGEFMELRLLVDMVEVVSKLLELGEVSLALGKKEFLLVQPG